MKIESEGFVARKKAEAAELSRDSILESNLISSDQIENFTPRLRDVIDEIDQIFGDVQVAGLTSFWRIGKIIYDVRVNPEEYLTPDQQASQIDGASLITAIFAPIYSADQLRNAVNFYEKYPSMADVNALLSLRCPDRPRWRMTISHAQMLAQIPDDDQRATLAEKCAEEAYTARNLAMELQDIRGNLRPGAGRRPSAPKGLKQQMQDLLQNQRRFIARSEKLWLSHDTENFYDVVANTPPEKIDANMHNLLAEIAENFIRMSDLVADHGVMCARVRDQLAAQESAAEESDDADSDAGAATTRRQRNFTR
jgi:hypothetical protein